MVFSSWLRTVTYIFYCIILVYKLFLLDWGILFGPYGSYEPLVKKNKIENKICIIIKKLFQFMQV